MPPVKTLLAMSIVTVIAGCSKSSPDKSEGSAAPPAGSASAPAAIDAAASQPTEGATVVGPTKSASGALELAGAITGTFEWKKKDQRNPITCVWDPAKEIGTVRVDLSDGAGKLITVAVDVPPVDAGMARVEVTSKDLAAPLKSSLGFNVSAEDPTLITVKFDTKLGDDEKKPDLTIKGTLEVSCPKRN
jgi:hypothetical protein